MSTAPKQLGSRFNTGKPKLSLIFEAKHAIAGLALVLMYG